MNLGCTTRGRQECQNEQPHYVVNDCCSQNDRGLGRRHFAGIHQSARRNGNAGSGQGAAHEARCRPGQPQQVAHTGAEKERPYDARERDHEGREACFAHAINIGFKPCNEHQHQATDLRHQQERARGLSTREQVHVEQIHRSRP